MPGASCGNLRRLWLVPVQVCGRHLDRRGSRRRKLKDPMPIFRRDASFVPFRKQVPLEIERHRQSCFSTKGADQVAMKRVYISHGPNIGGI